MAINDLANFRTLDDNWERKKQERRKGYRKPACGAEHNANNACGGLVWETCVKSKSSGEAGKELGYRLLLVGGVGGWVKWWVGKGRGHDVYEVKTSKY